MYQSNRIRRRLGHHSQVRPEKERDDRRRKRGVREIVQIPSALFFRTVLGHSVGLLYNGILFERSDENRFLTGNPIPYRVGAGAIHNKFEPDDRKGSLSAARPDRQTSGRRT